MTSMSMDRSGLRRIIASYPSYESAQAAVDQLSDRKFPVEHVSIVGSDLQLVEHVTGRLTVARAALAGSASGAWFGLLIGLVFWIVTPWTIEPLLAGIVLGTVFGALLGAVAHGATGGRRDFTSLRTLAASRYDVMADEAHADEALRILGRQESDTGSTASVDARPSDEPR